MVPLRSAGYSNAAIEDFYERALAELRAVPGVERVSARAVGAVPSVVVHADLRCRAPTSSRSSGRDLSDLLRGHAGAFHDHRRAGSCAAAASSAADRAGAPPVIIVEQALGEKLWPGQDPIGKCLILGRPDEPMPRGRRRRLEHAAVRADGGRRDALLRAAGTARHARPRRRRCSSAPAGDPPDVVAGDPRGARQHRAGSAVPRDAHARELAEPETRRGVSAARCSSRAAPSRCS